ncbi:MAG: DUF4922 domain-containing protein [Clostridium sp.]|nr:DUF4922 domain-containing protein [Clostridium sp.]
MTFESIFDSAPSPKILPGGIAVYYQPWRIRSSAAKTDPRSVASRPCFLCPDRRLPGQVDIPVEGLPYVCVDNPYPVLPGHQTIIADTHRPQQLTPETVGHFAEIAFREPESTLFYNGAGCGASAPDHLHFQRIPRWRPTADPSVLAPHIVIESADPAEAASQIEEALRDLEQNRGVGRDMVNIASWPGRTAAEGMLAIVIFPRRRLRPSFFSADPDDPEGMMISPATLEMLGTIVTPLEKDYQRIDAETVERIYREVAFPLIEEPELRVGILTAPEVVSHPDPSGKGFTLENVRIGIGFHWERREPQRFEGSIEIIPSTTAPGCMTAVNRIAVEKYLRSVVASEMNAEASLEFLKAHSVISRSWVIAQTSPWLTGKGTTVPADAANPATEDGEICRWYDRDDHRDFDLCADDHCQRYQGLGRITCQRAPEAVEATRGEVLFSAEGDLCDARFSKCCGGKFEEFDTCWQPRRYSYLRSLTDSPTQSTLPDLSSEQSAAEWILQPPADSFCDCNDPAILAQVLNSYDRESTDFYRWSVTYTAEELGRIISERSGIDFGPIVSLEPLRRGPSGRISRLRIIGERTEAVVGKELEIRRWLSRSHLRSSAFIVERDSGSGRLTLRGAGWGHGVGLCQIGAAVMSARGYNYREILQHYFPGSHVAKLY